MKQFLIGSIFLLIAQATPWGKGWGKGDGKGWEDKEYESPPFTVVRTTDNFEERLYPSALWACTNLTVDTAADPLWGLERRNFLTIMKSTRYKTKVPSTLMFWPLFRYIQGDNAKNQSIAMTKGVLTGHHMIKEDKERGDIELQEMCFYLESKFQVGGSIPVPAPTDESVYIVKKPDQQYYVRQFGGWAFTAATWLNNRDILQGGLEGEVYNHKLYCTAQKSHPWVPEEERVNEIMIPRLAEGSKQDLGVKVDFSQQPK